MAGSGTSCRNEFAGRKFAPTLAQVNVTRVDSVFSLTNNPRLVPVKVVVMRGIWSVIEATRGSDSHNWQFAMTAATRAQ